MKRILLITFMFVAISSQAQVIKKKISAMPEATTVTNGTKVIVADSGSDVLKSVTVAQLDSGIVANAPLLDTSEVVSIKFNRFTGSITDGAPTAAEIAAILGISVSEANKRNFEILDSNGTALIYLVTSDGTNWQYIVMTKAL